MPGGLATGQLLDERYALEEPLGEDALGTTWRAHDRGLGRTVCLREIHYPDEVFAEDPARLKQALMAARLAIRLDHAGAVHVYDAFLDSDRLMIVTESVIVKSLASLVERKGPVPPKRAAAIGLELLGPLAAAHAKGLVHGSITPAAVLVPDRGPSLLTGLGMAPTFLDDASRTWMDAMAVAACLAPEQVEVRGCTPPSDLWALGATLYFAVEGTHAFDSRDQVVDSPPRPAANAKALEPILERLLSKEPAWRPDIDGLRPELAAVAGIVLTDAEPAAAAPVRRRG
ncbi:MAG: serine/threonine-protein kinase, partial [Acidimicrobiales bacterium]